MALFILHRPIFLCVLSIFLLSGCASGTRLCINKSTEIIEAPGEKEDDFLTPDVSVSLHHNHIEVSVQQVPGHNVARIHAVHEANRTYLAPIYISSGGGHSRVFRIPYPSGLSLELPPARIYWIREIHFDGPFACAPRTLIVQTLPLGPGSNPTPREGED